MHTSALGINIYESALFIKYDMKWASISVSFKLVGDGASCLLLGCFFFSFAPDFQRCCLALSRRAALVLSESPMIQSKVDVGNGII